jgi:hypothetical protein
VGRAVEPDYVEFRPDERGEVVARMEEMARRGVGWANFQPGIEPEIEPVAYRSGLFGFLAASGPPVPVCTWAPKDRRRAPDSPVSIGVHHGSGHRAVRRLEELGLLLGEGWVVLQDHPRRGIVVSVPADEGNDTVLCWLLEAGRLLTAVPLTGEWRAAFYARR